MNHPIAITALSLLGIVLALSPSYLISLIGLWPIILIIAFLVGVIIYDVL